jgi:hypothetical protein
MKQERHRKLRRLMTIAHMEEAGHQEVERPLAAFRPEHTAVLCLRGISRAEA